MRLFRVELDKKFIEYKVQSFKDEHREEDLEYLLESNPDAILDEEILIIGRQVTTNLNTSMDLLGLDRTGNTVIIELKRDRTPRDTVAQALEYASFIDRLNYNQLEQIYQNYADNTDLSLTEQHRTFFNLEEDESVNINKEQHIIVLGSNISKEIRQQATYLNRKGLPVTCVEFNYFKTESGETLLSTDIAVSGENNTGTVSTEKRTQIDETKFMESLDDYSHPFFEQFLEAIGQHSLVIHWGTVGFSVNVDYDGKHVSICECFPPKTGTRRYACIYAVFVYIEKKIADSENLIEEYKDVFIKTGLFVSSGKNLRWNINTQPNQDEIKLVVKTYMSLAETLKKYRPIE